MLLTAGVVVFLLIVLRYLPLRSETLIEGVFDRKENSSDFYQEVIAFWFDNQCRECIEKNSEQEPLYGQCHTSVPAKAINLDSKIEPQNGDSIKIIAWKTIFGRVVAYKLARTNFAEEEEFVVQQLQKEEDEWEAYSEASDRREALRRGISLEEYRQAEKEEGIQYAVEQLELTSEEVVEHKYDELPQFMFRIVKKLTKELGRQPTKDEIWAEQKKDTEDIVEHMKSTLIEDYDHECIKYRHSGLYNEYIATGKSSNLEFTEHLVECQKCLSHLSELREKFLKSNTLDCLTADECGAMIKTGLELKNRQDHIHKCYHCWILFHQCKKEHLTNQSSQECLTKDALHTIHTTGEIPEFYKVHIENCLRCQKVSEKHKDAYIDKIIPQPKLPKTRFRSIRAKYKNPTTV